MAPEQAQSTHEDCQVAEAAAVGFGRAFTNAEVDAFIASLAADVDWEVPSVMQHTVMKLCGHDEVRDYIERTAGEYDELSVESKEIRDFGDGRFVMLGTWHAKPLHSPSVFGTPFGAVFDIRDGKVARLRAFFDEQLAIDAAGRD